MNGIDPDPMDATRRFRLPVPCGTAGESSAGTTYQDPDQVRTDSASHRAIPPVATGQKRVRSRTTRRRRTCWSTWADDTADAPAHSDRRPTEHHGVTHCLTLRTVLRERPESSAISTSASPLITLIAGLFSVAAGYLARRDQATYPQALTRAAIAFAATLNLAERSRRWPRCSTTAVRRPRPSRCQRRWRASRSHRGSSRSSCLPRRRTAGG